MVRDSSEKQEVHLNTADKGNNINNIPNHINAFQMACLFFLQNFTPGLKWLLKHIYSVPEAIWKLSEKYHFGGPTCSLNYQ